MKKSKSKKSPRKAWSSIFVITLAAVGLAALLVTRATTPYATVEPEAGTRTGSAAVYANSSAAGGSAINFATPAPTGGGICTNPFWSTSVPREGVAIGTDGLLEVRNEAWNPTHGPQTIYVCNEQSWYVLSNQTNQAGAVQTYPDTLYNVRSGKTIMQYNSITSTFAEEYQKIGDWNAGYDIWMNNWDSAKEVMIWNEWNGTPGYWPSIATVSLTLNGEPYKFHRLGGNYMFFRVNQVKSGSVDILAALKWLVAQGYFSPNDVPTQIEYGVEIIGTVGTQRFDTTGFTVNLN